MTQNLSDGDDFIMKLLERQAELAEQELARLRAEIEQRRAAAAVQVHFWLPEGARNIHQFKITYNAPILLEGAVPAWPETVSEREFYEKRNTKRLKFQLRHAISRMANDIEVVVSGPLEDAYARIAKGHGG